VRKAIAIIFMALFGLWGCGGGKDAPEVQPQSGLERARVILNDYAKGMRMGSEAMTFDEIVEDVRKTDPQKATILEKGFADIRRAPGNRSATARELLKKL